MAKKQYRNNYTNNINKLFVAYKPTGVSSNQFLSSIKRRYKTKKAGYSGTLDPFAKGVLIVALGSHTKLFRFLDKTPKSYRATLWLGAQSDTLDIEGVCSDSISDVKELTQEAIKTALKNLEGELTYTPPIFCAKSVDGVRAYDLARAGKEVKLEKITSKIFETKFIHYNHPFITFEATVSEGTYIRSLGEILAKNLNIESASLTSLERLNEGKFRYNGEKACDIKSSLNISEIKLLADTQKVLFGQPLHINDVEPREDGTYFIDLPQEKQISIIQIEGDAIKYILNKVDVC